jgi:hypothetical protein
MGRLTLNVLLSFAQFEREVTAERIRDKLAASKKKGLWMGGYVPMGYDADGRTLKIHAQDATTIRILYDLYLEQKLIRLVKEEAAKQGLRSKHRVSSKGNTRGGNLFSRGHIHHILTNPVYAGRIRHKDKVYDGQHPAIIDPEIWDEVQTFLKAKAPYKRGKDARATQSSLLIGKAFDETGDRLSPSHSQKNGKRLRYYISYRLGKRGGEAGLTGWRLPAQPFEDQITAAVSTYLTINVVSKILINPQIAVIQSATKTIANMHSKLTDIAAIIERIDIAPGTVTIALNPIVLANALSVTESLLNMDALTFSLPFQTRKRGVETKLIIGHVTPEKD